MKTLLTSIQTLLKAQLMYVKDVFITPDLYDFSDAPGFPMIGLLDNGDDPYDREKGAGNSLLKVTVGIYQSVAKPEASVIGDGIDKGVLEIKDDIWAELCNENFSGAYTGPFYKGSPKTQELYNSEENFAVLKIFNLEYFREAVEAT